MDSRSLVSNEVEFLMLCDAAMALNSPDCHVMIQIGQDDVHLACYGAHPFLTANNII
jgi:hypothetical protein